MDEDEAMRVCGILPVCRLNHIEVKFEDESTIEKGIKEYRTKITFKDGSELHAIYHQQSADVHKNNFDKLEWTPSYYELIKTKGKS